MILIISSVFPPEPIVSAQISFDIAEKLSLNNEVTVITPKPSRPMGFIFQGLILKKKKFNHYYLDSYVYPKSKLWGRFKESYSFGKLSSEFISKNYHNIEQIYNGAWPLFGQYLIARTAKKYKIPYVTSVQDLYPESILSKLPDLKIINRIVLYPLFLIDKYILTNSEKIHTISDSMKDYIVKTRKIKTSKICTVRNYQNHEKFLDLNIETRAGNNPFTFMYLGNVGALAGLDIVIYAFAKTNLPNARLVIAGAGSDKERLIRISQKFNAQIEFLDVPEGKVPEIQAKADILILPLKKHFAKSSIPSKLPAYQFSKKPIIACVDIESDTSVAIKDSKCGWVTEPENIEYLSKTMKEAYYEEFEILLKMGKYGYEYALENFSREKNLQKLVSLFEI